MTRDLPLLRAALCAGMVSASGIAAAWQDGAMGVYGAYGRALHDNGSTRAPSVGMIIPWQGWTPWTPGPGTSWYFDLFISHWAAPRNAYDKDNNEYTQIGAGAIWRHRFSEGGSPWFVEAGLGVSTTDRRYTTPDRGFSTRFNFVSQLGVGRSFGSDGRHELSVRVQHHSNGGIRSPNPGEDFVQLRYAYRY
jgi:lipid A 3-O-deacylase